MLGQPAQISLNYSAQSQDWRIGSHVVMALGSDKNHSYWVAGWGVGDGGMPLTGVKEMAT